MVSPVRYRPETPDVPLRLQPSEKGGCPSAPHVFRKAYHTARNGLVIVAEPVSKATKAINNLTITYSRCSWCQGHLNLLQHSRSRA